MLMALKHHSCSQSEKLAKPFEHCFAEESAVLSEQIFRIHFDEISLGQGKKQQLCSNIRKTHSSNVGNMCCFVFPLRNAFLFKNFVLYYMLSLWTKPIKFHANVQQQRNKLKSPLKKKQIFFFPPGEWLLWKILYWRHSEADLPTAFPVSALFLQAQDIQHCHSISDSHCLHGTINNVSCPTSKG